MRVHTYDFLKALETTDTLEVYLKKIMMKLERKKRNKIKVSQ